jgi:hypothetical protein
MLIPYKYVGTCMNIIIPHGITDIVNKRGIVRTNMIVNPLVYCMPDNVNLCLLGFFSIFHMRNDVPYDIYGSILLHILWLMEPMTSLIYLACIHTPRHYRREIMISDKKGLIIIIVIFFSILTNIVLRFNMDKILEIYLGRYWWVGPVISHIYMNDMNTLFNSGRVNKVSFIKSD